uniref:Uncharacterized protein n=1 Tax=Timema cristinae TaxID=61476 RepID=A0A7R9CJ80_TIMCR|nr:unnamed protein product [Timema cristinae]
MDIHHGGKRSFEAADKERRFPMFRSQSVRDLARSYKRLSGESKRRSKSEIRCYTSVSEEQSQVEPGCDSDEEVFWGPITIREILITNGLKKKAKLRYSSKCGERQQGSGFWSVQVPYTDVSELRSATQDTVQSVGKDSKDLAFGVSKSHILMLVNSGVLHKVESYLKKNIGVLICAQLPEADSLNTDDASSTTGVYGDQNNSTSTNSLNYESENSILDFINNENNMERSSQEISRCRPSYSHDSSGCISEPILAKGNITSTNKSIEDDLEATTISLNEDYDKNEAEVIFVDSNESLNTSEYELNDHTCGLSSDPLSFTGPLKLAGKFLVNSDNTHTQVRGCHGDVAENNLISDTSSCLPSEENGNVSKIFDSLDNSKQIDELNDDTVYICGDIDEDSEDNLNNTMLEMDMMMNQGFDYILGKENEAPLFADPSYSPASINASTNSESKFTMMNAYNSSENVALAHSPLLEAKSSNILCKYDGDTFKLPTTPKIKSTNAEEVKHSKKGSKFNDILSPVGAYIKNVPTPSLTKKIKLKLRKEDQSFTKETIKTTGPDEWVKPLAFPKQETPSKQLPKLADNMKKLILNSGPAVVIKHKGRIHFSPHHSPNVAVHSTEADVSMLVSKPALANALVVLSSTAEDGEIEVRISVG